MVSVRSRPAASVTLPPQVRPNDGWTLDYAQGHGYFVIDPKGRKASGFFSRRAEAEDRRDELRRQADLKAKKGKRPCMCCGRTFDSDGVHNRLCHPCKVRGYATWERF